MAAAAIVNLLFLSILVTRCSFGSSRPTTLRQNFINLCQFAAELLLFVQKSKMAPASILDFIFV